MLDRFLRNTYYYYYYYYYYYKHTFYCKTMPTCKQHLVKIA